MMTTYERSDIIHIMKMNRLTLSDSDTAQMEFSGQVKGKNYLITILVVEDLPQIFIKRDGEVIYSETIKSIDDLKIFLEEHLYKGDYLLDARLNRFYTAFYDASSS